MSGALDRLISCFVARRETDADRAAESTSTRATAARGGVDVATRDVAVVCRPADAAAAGGAVALALRSRGAVVALWGAEAPAFRAPPTPGARRIAARLDARGHAAVATGRLVVVALESGPDEAFRAAAAAAAPLVTVVAAARDERVDAVLRGHERAIAVGAGLVAELAATSLACAGIPSHTVTLPDAPVARWLAALGVALTGPMRAAVTEALR